uniref:C2H2-type domain-containing protein n=1 Tax=Aegilops tauschii subsp. strangulata TaxID=200361 RepID=A0A453K663_AEGTS
MHVFCLEHALGTWTQLQEIGGANVMLLCHPEYPRAESAAKFIAEELGLKPDWKDVAFEEATDDDIRRIQLALHDEDAEPASSDWAVKMGINIYYSAKQSKSPLYSKQIPYNSIIYEAFGQENPDNLTDYGRQRSGVTKKRVAGCWCGKVWMSNQVHPFLVREHEEHNRAIVCSKVMLGANYHEIVYDEPSLTCNTMVDCSPSKRISRRKGRDSIEKSGARKKRCSANDEAILHCSSLGMNSKTISDQPRNFDDHDKHEGGKITEAPSTQQYQQYTLQSMNMKSSSNKPKDDKGNRNFLDLYDEANDVDCWFNIDSGDNAAIRHLEDSRQQELGTVKAKSPGKLQGNMRKSSKCKARDDSLNGDKKVQKMNKKSISRKQKDVEINTQFREEYEGDNDMDCWHDIQGGDNATMGNLDNSPVQRLEAAEVKSGGKLHCCKRKPSKGKAKDGCQAGDKAAKFPCDIEGCDMSFNSQQDLLLHKRDICPVKGCKKKFFCHKYLLQHRKVHMDERPLNCEWKGCKKTFKWPWARTEHMRVHTGVRPYECMVPGCGQTFRFVSDFSRHKRKTGHSSGKKNKEST